MQSGTKLTLTAIQEKLDEAEYVEGCEKGKLARDEAVALSLGGVKPDA